MERGKKTVLQIQEKITLPKQTHIKNGCLILRRDWKLTVRLFAALALTLKAPCRLNDR